MGQAPTSAPKQPEHPGYVPDATYPITIQFTVPAGLANSFVVVARSGGPQAVLNSKAPSNEVQAVLKEYQVILDSVTTSSTRKIEEWDKKARARFTKDTTELYRVKPVNKK